MELGCDAVLCASAISRAEDPVDDGARDPARHRGRPARPPRRPHPAPALRRGLDARGGPSPSSAEAARASRPGVISADDLHDERERAARDQHLDGAERLAPAARPAGSRAAAARASPSSRTRVTRDSACGGMRSASAVSHQTPNSAKPTPASTNSGDERSTAAGPSAKSANDARPRQRQQHRRSGSGGAAASAARPARRAIVPAPIADRQRRRRPPALP